MATQTEGPERAISDGEFEGNSTVRLSEFNIWEMLHDLRDKFVKHQIGMDTSDDCATERRSERSEYDRAALS